MQVQANDILDKMSNRLGLLVKELVILETHNEMLIKNNEELNKTVENLKIELEKLRKPPEISNT